MAVSSKFVSHENWCSEINYLLKDEKEIWSIFSIFFFDLDKIRYKRCPQNFLSDFGFYENRCIKA
jgi:hypothetical protein